MKITVALILKDTTMKIKHYGFIIGLFLVIISVLFFGRAQNLYQLLSISGLLISLIFYLTILFSKDSVKSKIIWTIVLILSIVLQRLSEPILIKSSYLIYLSIHKTELKEVNDILLTKVGDITVLNDSVNDKSNELSTTEKKKLIDLRNNLKVYMISKTNKGVYFGLWGFLDVRLGITYCTDCKELDNQYKTLTDNWYY
jgi:hypothetical protein